MWMLTVRPVSLELPIISHEPNWSLEAIFALDTILLIIIISGLSLVLKHRARLSARPDSQAGSREDGCRSMVVTGSGREVLMQHRCRDGGTLKHA